MSDNNAVKLAVHASVADLVSEVQRIVDSLPGKGLDIEVVTYAEISDCPRQAVVLAPLEHIAPRRADKDGANLVWIPVQSSSRPLPAKLLTASVSAPWIRDAARWSHKQVLRQAIANLAEKLRSVALTLEIQTKQEHIHILNEVGSRLTREPHLESLLELIVRKAREILRCDAGSLYLVEQGEPGSKAADSDAQLSFVVAQNDSIQVPFKAFRMPLTSASVAGYVALTKDSQVLDDAYMIENKPYAFNRSFDESVGYRTKSMLVVPLVSIEGRCIGVLQLINKKPFADAHFSTRPGHADALTFSKDDRELAEALGSQAAVAVENARLYRDIQNLLESFMHASVTAIESRDPTTSGHSARVAAYSVRLAQMVDRADMPKLRNVGFDRKALEQLYFAGILHDFGKIGVREDVLVKAKKLYPQQMQAVSDRYQYMRRVLQLRYTEQKLAEATKSGSGSEKQRMKRFADIDKQLKTELERLDAAYRTILQANEPTVLHQDAEQSLDAFLRASIVDVDGSEIPFLTPDEHGNLSIGKGSLNDTERLEIESHVQHTYNFLKRIPWTRDLAQVPDIAYGHHEKLDGTGYPRRLKAPAIAPAIRVMTVCDIYDALTAQDRPYKRAVPVERALGILEMEVREGKLDPSIVSVFIETKAYEAKSGDMRDLIGQ